MKRIIALFILLTTGITLFAAEVSQQQAMEKARAFMQQRIGGKSNLRRAPLNITMQQTETGLQSLYAFNAEGGGFVIVSGDDRIDGVLGYSPIGYFDGDNMPPTLKNLLEQYAALIVYLQQTNSKAPARISRPHPPIPPLLKTDWGQMEPYNRECPSITDFNSGKEYLTATGCVATAMAQVLNYHQWPKESTTHYTTPSGKIVEPTTFDWSQMLENYREQEYNEVQASAVAHLMSWCGKSVDMKYAASSGAFTPDIAPALRNCFNCDQGTRQVFRYEVSKEEWEELIYQELANGRPVIYNGGNSVDDGHCFVCDGYDGYGMYAINWGWYGVCNGFYDLSILETVRGGTGGSVVINRWSVNQDIIIGIQPPVGTPTPDLPSDHMSISGMFILSDSIVTRNADTGCFPAVPLAFSCNYQTSKTDYTKPFKYIAGFALTKTDGTIIEKLGTTTFMPSIATNMPTEHLRQGDVILPDGLADGIYRIVPWFTLTDSPDRTYPFYGSDRRYIQLSVQDGKAIFKVFPQHELKFRAPQFQCDGNGIVQSMNLSIRNFGPDEYNGNIFAVNNVGLFGFESLYLQPDTTYGTKCNIVCRNPGHYENDMQYSVYCDPSLFKPVYGEPVQLPEIKDFSISRCNIDSVRHTVFGNIMMGQITVTNTGNATATQIFLWAIDSVGNRLVSYSVEDVLEAGKTSQQDFTIKLPQDSHRIALMLVYRPANFMACRAVMSDILTVESHPFALNSAYQMKLLDRNNPVMPEDYTAFMSGGCVLESITPNSNPNTVYYVENSNIESLKGHIIADLDKGSLFDDITYYDDRELFQPIQLITSHDVNYIRTFGKEEVGHWSSFSEICISGSWGMSDLESITDANTGEDLSQYFKWYSAGKGEKVDDKLFLTPVASVINDMAVLFRVAPEVAGRTVSFKGYSMNSMGTQRGRIFTTTFKQTLPYFYEIADDQLVLRKNTSPQPHRFYFVPLLSEGQTIDSLPASYQLATEEDFPTAVDVLPNEHNQWSDSQLYDLQGRRVTGNPSSGLYIKGGKKTYIK
jgi:hypothetical protein